MNLHKPILSGFVVGSCLVASSSGALAATFSGEFFYTRYATDPTNPANIKKANFNYNNIAGNFTVGTPIGIATTPAADGLIFAPDGDLIVGAAKQLYKVNENTGTFTTATAGGTYTFHMTVDPSTQKIWGGGGEAGEAGEGEFGGTGIPLAEIPLNPFQNGIQRPLTGDDTFITQIAFDRSGKAFYTASGGGGNGSFGIIDLNNFTTKRLFSGLAASHGMVFDPFTEDLMLFGANHITQIDPETGAIVSDRAFSAPFNFDQGTADGNGHLFVADNGGHLIFVDYSSTRKVGDGVNFVATPFLDSHLDDIAPMSGLGSKHIPEPSSALGLLAFGAFGVTSLLKRKQQQKALNSVVTD